MEKKLRAGDACPDCKGTGFTEDGDHCELCDGKGKIDEFTADMLNDDSLDATWPNDARPDAPDRTREVV